MTFILRQVTSLNDLGHEVDRFSDTGNEGGGSTQPEIAKVPFAGTNDLYEHAPGPPTKCRFPITGKTWPPGSSTSISNAKRVLRVLPVFLRCLLHAPKRGRCAVLKSSHYGYQAGVVIPLPTQWIAIHRAITIFSMLITDR